jgi:hypothetical protein
MLHESNTFLMTIGEANTMYRRKPRLLKNEPARRFRIVARTATARYTAGQTGSLRPKPPKHVSYI